MKKKLLIFGLVIMLFLAFTVTPVAAQPTQHKQVNTIYVWTNGTPSARLTFTIWALSKRYHVEVKPYAGNNAARFMYGVMSAPAITVMYSAGSVSEPIDAFTTYNTNYGNIQHLIHTRSP